MSAAGGSEGSEIGEDDPQELSCRGKVSAVMTSYAMDAIMGAIIVGNTIVQIFETDMQAACDALSEPSAVWHSGRHECHPGSLQLLDRLNRVCLAIYVVELGLRLFAFRLDFLFKRANLTDLFIVSVGLVDLLAQDIEEFPDLLFCRIFRTLPHHRDGDWCAHAFSTVVRASLYFFQTLISGDSWGACSIPIMRAEPLTYFVFVGAHIIVTLGLVNLILAVIVDCSSNHNIPEDERILEKQRKVHSFTSKLKDLLKCVDYDQSGTITMEEMVDSFRRDPDVRRQFQLLDLKEADLELVFRVLGREQGELSYNDFVDYFEKAQLQDQRTYFMMMNLQVQHIAEELAQMKQVISVGNRPFGCLRGCSDGVGLGRAEAEARVQQSLAPQAAVSASALPPGTGDVNLEEEGFSAEVDFNDAKIHETLAAFELNLESRLQELARDIAEGAAALAAARGPSASRAPAAAGGRQQPRPVQTTPSARVPGLPRPRLLQEVKVSGKKKTLEEHGPAGLHVDDFEAELVAGPPDELRGPHTPRGDEEAPPPPPPPDTSFRVSLG